jgi:hypothetical protein
MRPREEAFLLISEPESSRSLAVELDGETIVLTVQIAPFQQHPSQTIRLNPILARRLHLFLSALLTMEKR